ncbi:hypothetical protein CSB45_06715 [candidate division KSB3 bacterium]|uniref:Uncharacterized protein n=1 Tax=candidate division KSB3 bacterium TaxID=2044937 RepID=A0A2G6E618_9BACT|nr:MAG: hypothetical protein CSB45_06715 [candidate division KSB3 bacterium]PIE30073.1 MAG: hypothetical protein CSA57_05880 [candidate division KSB3 bacterium]
MPVDTEDGLKQKLDEIRLTCDAIENQVQTAGGNLSYLDKSKCMSLAMELKDMALEAHNYFAYLED